MEEKFPLQPRLEDVREPRTVPIQFDLLEIKKHFDESIASIESQSKVLDNLTEDEGKNILRAQVVFAEAVLDFYIHEISKYALYQMFCDEWEHSEKYGNMLVPMDKIVRAFNSKEYFFQFLNDHFSQAVFLSAESMRDQLNLIGIPFAKVMKTAFPMQTEEESIKKGKEIIINLFSRRNAIAHQIDRSHESAEQNDITVQYVNSCIKNIKSIVEAINSIASTK